MDPSRFFRAGVGIVLIDRAGVVLAFERADVPGNWQLVQGGLKAKESVRDAAEREIREEIGIRAEQIEYLAEHPEWLAYELPLQHQSKKTGRGQVHRWLLYRFTGTDADFDFGLEKKPEFGAVKRTTLAALAEETAPFRRAVYEQLARAFAEYL